ncbi:MAG: photosynthetic complex assembly protein PuhC [Pseudomonadota bacterium]
MTDLKMMRGVAALVAAALIFTAAHVLTGRSPGYSPGLDIARPAIEGERTLGIASSPGGAALVVDADGAEIARFGEGEANFISMMHRALLFERDKVGAERDAPVRVRWRGGARWSIYDPATGDEYDLASYGPQNVDAFAALYEMSSVAETERAARQP